MSKYIIILALLTSISSLAYDEPFKMEDQIFVPNISTVLLYPNIGELENPKRLISPPIIALHQGNGLMLEFDDLSMEYANYKAKIFHCNSDWKKSTLNDIEFTFEYNEYPITEQEQSFSTKIPYYHYRFELPKLKISGNFVVVVYNGKKAPIFSRRFMVYDPRISIAAKARFSQGIQQQFSDQQIDFTVDYKGLNLAAPQSDLKIIMRQNFRWDKTRSGFKPSNVRPFDKILEYTFFSLENTFPGGNEFRYFDSRSLSGRGYGISEIERTSDFTRLILFPDKSRTNNGYLQVDDLNGMFIVDQRESGRGSTDADYTPVLFSLKTDEDVSETYYVNGAFNYWNLNERNRLIFNPDTGLYEVEILIKQGVVNYNYVQSNGKLNKERTIEGDYASTENDYDILVYYKPPAGRSELLIGYTTVEWNRRR